MRYAEGQDGKLAPQDDGMLNDIVSKYMQTMNAPQAAYPDPGKRPVPPEMSMDALRGYRRRMPFTAQERSGYDKAIAEAMRG